MLGERLAVLGDHGEVEVAVGTLIFMARRNCRLAQVLVAGEFDLADLHRAFLDVEVTCTEAGGMVFTSVLMVANWWPCSERMSLRTVSARLILVGSYWLSTERPTFSFLKRSSTSSCETALSPL